MIWRDFGQVVFPKFGIDTLHGSEKTGFTDGRRTPA